MHTSHTNVSLGLAITHAVSHRPLNAEARFRFRVSPCGMCGELSCTGTGFAPNSSVSPVSIIPPWLSVLLYRLRNE
jgi:hypothetical protein